MRIRPYFALCISETDCLRKLGRGGGMLGKREKNTGVRTPLKPVTVWDTAAKSDAQSERR